jgi:Acetyltransferase (GNAT) domain
LTNKEKYRQFCKAHTVAIYQNDWWLDAVCGEKNWEAAIYESKGKAIAAWAYPFKNKYGLKLIQMPMLTLGLGPISEKKEIVAELAKQVPNFDLLDLYFLPNNDPEDLNWKGLKQSKRHTYRIHDLSGIEKVFSKFNSSTRQQIRKAAKTITVSQSEDIELLYKMVSHTFKRQSKKTPYSLAYVKSINEACAEKKCRKILVAKDEAGNTHSACFIAWDKNTTYYVMGGSDPQYKSSASYSLLMHEAIKEASKHSKEFDFCGSSIPSIAKFFSGFGSEQVTYYHLKKVNSKALKLFLSLKGR